MMSAFENRRTFQPLALFATLAIAGAAVLFIFDPSHWAFYPGCIFYRATGLLCPGCGSLRALHQLLHGHLATALRCNPLLFLTLLFVAGLGLVSWVRPESAFQLPARNGPLARPVWLWIYLGLVVVFWIIRNLQGPVFALLRP